MAASATVLRVVVEPLPARAAVAAARRAGVAPDPPVVVQLVQLLAGGSNRDGLRVVVEPLPPGTAVAAARRSGVAPDPAVVVQLIQLAAGGGDGDGLRSCCRAAAIRDSCRRCTAFRCSARSNRRCAADRAGCPPAAMATVFALLSSRCHPGTAVAAARRARVTPDPAVIVKLIELVPAAAMATVLELLSSRCQPGHESSSQGPPV